MQIKSIGIYNAAGAKRLVKFNDGLNILTGWSGTGKSSFWTLPSSAWDEVSRPTRKAH